MVGVPVTDQDRALALLRASAGPEVRRTCPCPTGRAGSKWEPPGTGGTSIALVRAGDARPRPASRPDPLKWRATLPPCTRTRWPGHRRR